MHKLNIPDLPNGFVNIVNDINKNVPFNNYKKRWNLFRDTDVYKHLVESLKKNQSSLCAYCEKIIGDNNYQIEHFKPKSLSTENIDYTLIFSNLLLCCNGKNGRGNTTCGQHKDNEDPDIKGCLNPYTMKDILLFKCELADSGIKLMPYEKFCKESKTDIYLVQNTIDLLNLNSSFLCEQRQIVWIYYQKLILSNHDLIKSGSTNFNLLLKEKYYSI
jgi:uncharacterized protein (TIGR02646 family)